MAETSPGELIEQFVIKYLMELRSKLEQCNVELIAQSLVCPSTLLSLDMIDNSLKEFVRSHQKHWLNQVNYQLTKFKDDIHQQHLWKELSSHLPNVDQLLSKRIVRMIAMQEVRLHAIEEMVMFEEQLSHQIVPKSFSCSTAIIIKKQDLRNEQRPQRAMLDDYVQKYESLIQSYDSRYQQELSMLELDLAVERNDNSHTGKALIDCMKSYVSHRNDQIERESLFKVAFFRSELSRRCRRHYRSSSRTTETSSIVFPQAIVDTPNVPLNKAELAYLSRGKNITCIL